MQPRIMALRERYAGDKQRMNQGMMELYKEEKINPLGGCLPIAVQIPVFIALYWVLLESVELRQASFIFWLDDLSLHDEYFVLPLLMGRNHVHPAETQSRTAGSAAGQDHDGATHRVHLSVFVFSIRPGALLVRQQPAVDRTAVGHHA